MDQIAEIRRVTFYGMAVNILLAILKMAGGLFCRSHALVADAIHSLSDLVTDLAVVFGVRFWTAPADGDHPYGHGKIQALVTLFIALALVVVAWELGTAAVSRLRVAISAGSGPSVAPVALWTAFLLAFVSIFAKEGLFRWTRRVARRQNSSALEANAWHHRSDAISSVPVAIALALSAIFPSLGWADSAGALIVAFFILKVSFSILRGAYEELTDADIDGKAREVEAVVRRIPGVKAFHQVRARRYGGAFQADLHIQVEPTLSVAEGHALGHAVKDAILSSGIDVNDVVVHVEPGE